MTPQIETQKARFTNWAFPHGSTKAGHHRNQLEFIPIGSYGDLFAHSFLTNAACRWNNSKRLNSELALICEPYELRAEALVAVDAMGFTLTPLGDCHFWDAGTKPVALNFRGGIPEFTAAFMLFIHPELRVTDLKYLTALNVKGAI
jgi:hypothetical protein